MSDTIIVLGNLVEARERIRIFNSSFAKYFKGKIDLLALNLTCDDFIELKPDIKKLKRFKYLNLSGNKFTKLPSEIGELTNIKALNLTNNQVNNQGQYLLGSFILKMITEFYMKDLGDYSKIERLLAEYSIKIKHLLPSSFLTEYNNIESVKH